MPTRFNIPGAESYLPTPATPNQPLSFMPQDDPNAQSLQELLSSLESARPPEPRQVSAWQKVLGGLGDAIQAMAVVRAGGAPPAVGAFAAHQYASQEKNREETLTAEAENRGLRNKVRVGAFEEGLRAKREKEVAALRASRTFKPQLKNFTTTDANGRPIQVPYLFNPNDSTLAPVEGYEEGFQQFVRPFLAQGVNTETGQLEYRLVEPFQQTGHSQAGPKGRPSEPGKTTVVPDLEPKPSTSDAEAAEAASVIGTQIDSFEKLALDYISKPKVLGTARAVGQTVVRSLPGGQVASEVYGDPAFEELAALRDRIGQQLSRLVENGRLSDQDREFALKNLPNVAALTTEDGRQTAAAKIRLVKQEIGLRLARKRRLRPGLLGGGTAPPSEAPSTGGTALERARELIRKKQAQEGAAP